MPISNLRDENGNILSRAFCNYENGISFKGKVTYTDIFNPANPIVLPVSTDYLGDHMPVHAPLPSENGTYRVSLELYTTGNGQEPPENPENPNQPQPPSIPSTPGTSTVTTPTPTDTPSAPTPTPDAPTDTPSAPTPAPDAPTETPSAPTPTPDAPTTTVVERPDGSKTETTVSTVTKNDGSVVQTTEVVNKDAAGNTTGSSIKTTISADSQNGASIAVNVSKDGNGKITKASAKISGTSSQGTPKALVSGSAISQIIETAGTKNVTVTIENKNGSKTSKVVVNTADLTAGKKLGIVRKNPNGTYVLVNAKTYTVTKDGDVFASVNGNQTYELMNSSKMNTISKKILQTVKARNTSKAIKKSKTTKMALKDTLNMDNVKSIKYTVSKKSVAAVTKNGIVKGKKPGDAVVKAKVTLKNGKTKTVKMRIKVKK